jgi:hypothetical protein
MQIFAKTIAHVSSHRFIYFIHNDDFSYNNLIDMKIDEDGDVDCTIKNNQCEDYQASTVPLDSLILSDFIDAFYENQNTDAVENFAFDIDYT